MNEIDFLSRIPAKKGRGIVLGIGDDCAIFRPRNEDLLFTTDMMIENVHFHRLTHPPEAVGWKTLARGLSDIAAMGGEPRFCLLSLALAEWTDRKWTGAFYRGLLKLAGRTGTVLAGGDISHAEVVACDIVVCGSVPRGKALRRDGARPGDGIYVSGALGGSALGLETGRGGAWKKHSRPEPRLELGRALRGRATACMDLSDGISLDLHRLCLASRAAAELDEVPVFTGATLEQALHGGEDYELLFTAPRPVRGAMRVGTIVRGKPGLVRFQGRRLEPIGYDHLQHRRRLAPTEVAEFPEF
jgi:thiamine-monophosphate kinase